MWRAGREGREDIVTILVAMVALSLYEEENSVLLKRHLPTLNCGVFIVMKYGR
jgi:hypothetical protein